MSNVANIDDWPDNSSMSINSERGELLLVKRGGEVFIYDNRCPHTGETLDPMGGSVVTLGGLTLACQRHAAEFISETGECVAGPCIGEHLVAVPFTLTNGDIYLD
jgi:nitrite reductase/ring-hydroxylating ferredoxin subunit